MKKIAMLMLAFLLAVLPQSAVHAATQKNVILKTGEGKVAIDIALPDTAAKVSTLRLRIKIEGDVDKVDQKNPLNFKADDEISETFLETRYNSENHTYTIYISDNSRLTDKTEFCLGTLTPNSSDDTEYNLMLTVEEDGLEYIDGNGELEQEMMATSVSAGIQMNQQADDAGDDAGDDTGDDGGNGGSVSDGSGTESGNGGGTAGNDGSENTGGNENTGVGAGSSSGADSDSSQKTEKDQKNSQASAKTGDENDVLLYGIMAGAAAVGVGCILVIRKKKHPVK